MSNRTTSGGNPTAPTSSMWGKKGRGYPELAKKGEKK